MTEFWRTGYGRQFFEGQLPDLIGHLGRIADALERRPEAGPPPAVDELAVAVMGASDVDAVKAVLQGIRDRSYELGYGAGYRHAFAAYHPTIEGGDQ